METLLNVSLPFFGLIFTGYAAGYTRLITAQAYLGLNAFVIWFALPSMLFLKMSEAPVFEAFDPKFVAAYTGGGLLAYGLVVGLSRLLFLMKWGERAVQGMGASFGNVGFMGLPILVTLFGDAAVLPAVLVIVFDHILLIPLTTAIIEGSGGGHAQGLKPVSLNPELDRLLNGRLIQCYTVMGDGIRRLAPLEPEALKVETVSLAATITGALMLEVTGRLKVLGDGGEAVVRRAVQGLVERLTK